MTAGLAAPLVAQFESLPADWRLRCAAFLAGPVLPSLCRFVDNRIADGATVYPQAPLAALSAAGFDAIRVVILGQDPYHGPGQAHGLAFSVRAGVRAPPSLRNILAEAARDACGNRPGPVCLQRWARQGVLLLNSVLTVEQGQPGSHAGRGWEAFTGAIIEALARRTEPKVFLLWGAQAQAHEPAIARGAGAHLVLKANHPSPLSARRAPAPFVGCGHFSQANDFLVTRGRVPIDWCAPD
jgi:uracil-DNA glycosylase